MKFLHAADIHLDSPLRGLALRHGIPAHVTKDCTRKAFTNLIDLAITEDVAFLLIAGDLYDGDWRDFSTGLFFNEQMRRLARPCIIVRGNHDAASVISRDLTPPPNVHVMSARKVDVWTSDELGVVVHGRSFPDRHIPEDFSAAYPGPDAGRLSIAMLHTSAEDIGEHEVYAPCRVGALAALGYDYWALGHIHDRRVLNERPLIVFPGNTQGRHIKETGSKGATLVEVVDRQIVSIAHRATDVLRWARIEIALDSAETITEVAFRLRFAFEQHTAETEGRPLLARVVLVGATALHAAFVADPARIEAECLNVAQAVASEMYIERVVLLTRPPLASGAGATADLEAAFAQGLQDEDTVEKLLAEFRRLQGDLPRIPGQDIHALPQSLADVQKLLPDAWTLAEQALHGGSAQ